VVKLADEQNVDALRPISLLLDRENQRLIAKNLELRAELARLRGLPDVAQLAFTVDRHLQDTRTRIFQRDTDDTHQDPPPPTRPPQPGHDPREQPTLPIVEIRHELAVDERQCPACGGALTEMTGQCETSTRVTTVKLTYHVEHHHRQKYRCACNGAVVTAPAPAQLIPGGRYAPECAVGVAVAKYADHLPLERQVRMMAREGLRVESQTLWDQIQALARHLEPTYAALGRRALDAPVINVDETRWPRLGSSSPSAGTVWGVHPPDRVVLSHLAGQVDRRRAPGPRRLSRDGGRRWLRGVRGPRA
jgi:transposase